MSLKLIEMLRSQRNEYVEAGQSLTARQEQGEELSDSEAATLAEALAKATELDGRVAELQAAETERMKAAMRDAEFQALQESAKEHATGRVRTEDRPKSLGEQWTESTQFQEYLARRAGTSGVLSVEFNVIKSTDTAGKPFAGSTKTVEAAMPFRATPLLDAAMPIEVSTNDYWWEEWPVTVPSAPDVDEAAAKTEADIQPENKFGQLGKAAHWITVTEEALQDNTAIRSRIDNELVDGVRQRGEEKAIAALIGATLPTATHGESLMKAIRVGIAKVQMAGFGVGGQLSVALNPLDYADIDIELLALTLQGARRESPLWQLNIAPAGAVTQGTAYVGDLYRGMRKYYRSEAQVKMSDSHAGLFIENKYVILAEQRLSVHIARPEAIAECSVAAGP